jgi:hypothetical protein
VISDFSPTLALRLFQERVIPDFADIDATKIKSKYGHFKVKDRIIMKKAFSQPKSIRNIG